MKHCQLSTGIAGVQLGRFSAALLFLTIVPTHAIGADRLVLAEEFTAPAWCDPCKLAGPALDRLLDNYPNDFLTLEYHVGDPYATAWGNARHDYYGVWGIPWVEFDGVITNIGAHNMTIQWYYDQYAASLNTRMNVPTDVLIDISAVSTGGQTYDVTTTVSVEAGGTAKSMRIYLAEALDHWPTPPSYSRNTFRNILVGGQGITLSPGQSRDIHTSVTFDQTAWSNFDNLKMIAWAQQVSGPAEIYNAAQYYIDSPLAGDFDDDGDVDGADFLAWQRGESPMPRSPSDLDDWQDNFGPGAALMIPASTAVPEPATGLMLMFLLLGIAGKVWRGAEPPGFAPHNKDFANM